MKPDNTPANAAEDSPAAPEQALTDEALNVVVGGVGGLVHEGTHSTAGTGGGTHTGGRFMLDITGHGAGFVK